MPALHAFGNQPDSAEGAWCWIGTPGHWSLFGIDMTGTRVEMYEQYGPADTAAPTPPAGVAAWF